MAQSASHDVTPLGFALLGEIKKAPRGGYALRRVFETTPLGIFSSSPGSIYPALKRLEQQGLAAAAGSGRGGRFEITARGRSVLDAWLAQPVTDADVSGRLDLCLLRFAFMAEQSDPSISSAFLSSLADAAESRRNELLAFLDCEEGLALPLGGRLAVEHGARTMKATQEWAADAQERLERDKGGNEK